MNAAHALLKGLGLGPSSSSSSSPDRHATSYSSSKMRRLYSPLTSPSPSAYDDDIDDDDDQLHPAQRAAVASTKLGTTYSPPHRPSSSLFVAVLPTPARFLSDFTLGFADGLTVPFALTAGLSSLGQTDTVIYAGMAEICAGSISMGIGGYLAARGEALDDDGDSGGGEMGPSRDEEEAEEEEEEEKKKKKNKSFTLTGAEGEEGGDGNNDNNVRGEEEEAAAAAAVAQYLAPLDLPRELRAEILAHVASRPHVAGAVVARQQGQGGETGEWRRRCSPVVAGLSVALGYLLGGLLPLFPYFFVSHVGDGLVWSFVVCLLALFLFGFSKDFFPVAARLAREDGNCRTRMSRRRRVPWRRIRRSIWEGVQMVILGGAAALAAVLCVRLFEGFNVAR